MHFYLNIKKDVIYMDSDPEHKNKIKFNKEEFIFITDLKVLI